MKVRKSVKFFLKSSFCFILSLIIIATNFSSAFAKSYIPSGREEAWQQNNILFYTTDRARECGRTATPTAGWDGSCANLSNEQKAWVEKWHSKVASLGSKYNIPWEAVLAQSILESDTGKSNFARNRHNFFGIGAFDSNTSKAYSWHTDEEGWEGYFKFISGLRPDDMNNHGPTMVYKKNGATSPPASTDPYLYISILKKSGYATDANYIQKNSALICGIQQYAKSKGWPVNATSSSSSAGTSSDSSTGGGGEDGTNVTIIGDSITEITSAGKTINGAKNAENKNDTNDFEKYLPNAAIYAQWGKHFDSDSSLGGEGGISILESLISGGSVRKNLVFALGTNDKDSVTEEQINKVIDLAGSERNVIFVTNTIGSSPISGNNSKFRSAASSHSNVKIADWASVASGNTSKYIDPDDEYHPSIHEGTLMFASLIYNAVNGVSDCPSGGSGGGGESKEIVSGGFKSVSEAAEFMRVYIDEARKRERVNPKSVAGTPVQSPSSGFPKDGTLNNCSAFTQWFVRHYTSFSNAPLVDGHLAAERYAEMGLGDGQVHYGVPQVYAVMSKGTSGSGKHTGIVLGIDKDRNKIIIGEASYNNGFVEGSWPYAHEYSLSTYQSSSIRYAYTGLSGV